MELVTAVVLVAIMEMVKTSVELILLYVVTFQKTMVLITVVQTVQLVLAALKLVVQIKMPHANILLVNIRLVVILLAVMLLRVVAYMLQVNINVVLTAVALIVAAL